MLTLTLLSANNRSRHLEFSMRLKRIKLAGFKSFVDSTSIPFPGEMTAVVGPNGCGKSNVIDAVRWVLGESSAKNLRGDAMTDVIFNGSTARKPVSQCSVELLFDNSSGRIQGEFANYNELAVKRIVTREAQSTYFLNGTKCRRRDVTDLFLGTGLGPRSYAIIEQGMISRLIESKPQELRIFIEEAAGISKYKERRRETENRIRHTRENLERLEDVRSELNVQLDKLQRQASAAQRFTELKKKERALKGELAGIRWLTHSQHIEQLTLQIREAETDCEALIAKQRGDEHGITKYRLTLSELAHTIDDLQQQQFKISTDITRIEQSQKFTAQRKQQITNEIKDFNQQLVEIKTAKDAANSRVQDAQSRLSLLEPEHLILAEQLDAAIDTRQSTENTLSEFAQTFRQQEQNYNQLKQQGQTCHSQIQSTMSMQMRTQQRLSDIVQELSALDHDQLNSQLDALESEQALIGVQFQEAEQLVETEKAKSEEVALEISRLTSLVNEQYRERQHIEAKCEALKAIQQSEADSIEEQELREALQPLWQILNVKQGYEALVDTAIQNSQNYFVVDNYDAVEHSWLDAKGAGFLFSQQWQTKKQQGTLAEAIENPSVPAIFNSIYIAETYDSGVEKLKHLIPNSAVVTKEGQWLMHDSMYTGVEQSQGKTLRQAKIDELELAVAKVDENLIISENEKRLCSEMQEQLFTRAKEVELAQQNVQQAKFQLQNRVSVVQMQLEQSNARKKKLVEERDSQQTLLTKEQQQLEELSAKVAEIEEQLLNFEADQLHYESEREKHEYQVQEARSQVEQLTRKKHQNDIEQQQIRGQLENATERLLNDQSQLDSAKIRIDKLENELCELNSPETDQQANIELLIAQREDVIERKLSSTEQLNNIESLVKEAEKDQQAVTALLQKRRENLESLNIESQGYKVRTDAVLEQLAELNQTLKDVLERLPDNANEKSWQIELDKTQVSVSRLGAVNLAAVEEFNSQSQRKLHLDTQFDDLQSALDTLEEAIRKIDKETKTRFSQTFEQVNSDLKNLFPKVFGGGSAYLAMTEDDLLETGVTIMARPPGKKNSTIHLLSGGEKALTALSLVFAIFRLNPAPFCLLDEVDAPLDDANVERFCRLVSEMSKTVQFIYITHNKIAMEMAEHLTGVTMAEPGVSRMVAVDVEEAVAIANA